MTSIKICDFGLSAQFEYDEELQFQSDSLSGHVGTRIYMAPEILKKRNYGKVHQFYINNILKLVDIWSCGIILYMLLSNGKHPLYVKGESFEQYKEKLKAPKWDFPDSFTR